MSYAENMKAARDQHGWSLEDAAFEVKRAYPESGATIARIRSIEKGTRHPNIELLIAMCDTYRVGFDETCPELVGRRDQLLALLGSSPIDGPEPTGAYPSLLQEAA